MLGGVAPSVPRLASVAAPVGSGRLAAEIGCVGGRLPTLTVPLTGCVGGRLVTWV